MFIVIEGVDGTGNNTQSEHLKKRLEKCGYSVRIISFPAYGKKHCQPTEMYLAGQFGGLDDVTPMQASVTYAVDRMGSYLSDWKNYKEDFIIFDRYTTSNIVHQLTKIEDFEEGKKLLKKLEFLEYDLCGLPKPDKVIYLDMDMEVSKELRGDRGRNDLHEDDNEYMDQCVIRGKKWADYLHWDVINCTSDGKLKSVADIHEDIFAIIEKGMI